MGWGVIPIAGADVEQSTQIMNRHRYRL